VEYEWSTGFQSDGEGALHLGGLELALRAFPVTVDVRRHLERGMAEVSGEPGDLRAALESTLGERVPQAVERSSLLRRSDPWNVSPSHRRVEVASKDNRRCQESSAVESRKDEAIVACTRLLAPKLS